MSHSKHGSHQKDYFYTALEGSIQLESGEGRFIEYKDGDGCDGVPPPCPVWRCLQGDVFCHPDSLDVVKGVFTAPSSSFYDVSLWVNYFYIQPMGTEDINGTTTTTLRRNLKKNICGFPGTGFGGLDIAIPLATNVFSRFGDNSIAGATISCCLPLQRGEQLKVHIFQQNDQGVPVTMFAEWLVKRGKRIDECLAKCRGLGCKDYKPECKCSYYKGDCGCYKGRKGC